MRSPLRSPAGPSDLGSILLGWSHSGNTGAIAVLCEEVAGSNVELLETTFFSLLDRADPALEPTLDLMCAAIGRSRRTQHVAPRD